MGRKSSIRKLPDEIKRHIEAQIAAGVLTLDELIAELQARWPSAAQAGQLPSRSTVHRYGQKLERRLTAIKASTEAMRMIREQAGDEMDARSEALTALVQTDLFEAILAMQEADDPEASPADRVATLSNAARHLATLTRSSVNIRRYQADAEDRARVKLLEEQRARIDAMPTRGGVTLETKAAIREALGIV